MDLTSAYPATVRGNSSVIPPPPFSPFMVGLLAVLGGVVSLATVAGNLLVVAAFVVERNLRTHANYFVASLALTDILIGALSMNCYNLYLLLGYWPMGELICDLWLSLDYTLSLSSQYTVFFITLDRYCSVTMPAKYRNWRTEGKVYFMVAITWIIPALIFFSTIMGWPHVSGREREETTCYAEFVSNAIFNLFLTLGYYWLTLVVMCILYAGIYRVALNLQRKSDAKREKVSTLMSMAGRNMSRIGVSPPTSPHNNCHNNYGNSVEEMALLPGSSPRSSQRQEQHPTRRSQALTGHGCRQSTCRSYGQRLSAVASSDNHHEVVEDESSSMAFMRRRKHNTKTKKQKSHQESLTASFKSSDGERVSHSTERQSPLLPTRLQHHHHRFHFLSSRSSPTRRGRDWLLHLLGRRGGRVANIGSPTLAQRQSSSTPSEPPPKPTVLLTSSPDCPGGGLGTTDSTRLTPEMQELCMQNNSPTLLASSPDNFLGLRFIDQESLHSTPSQDNIKLLWEIITPTIAAVGHMYEEFLQQQEHVTPLPASLVNYNPMYTEWSPQVHLRPQIQTQCPPEQRQANSMASSGGKTLVVSLTTPHDSPGATTQISTATISPAPQHRATNQTMSKAQSLRSSTLTTDSTIFFNRTLRFHPPNPGEDVPCEQDSDLQDEDLGPRHQHRVSSSATYFSSSSIGRVHRGSSAFLQRCSRMANQVKTVCQQHAANATHRSNGARKERGRSENRARKALRTITVILGAFLLCWTPYHVLILIKGFCDTATTTCVNDHLYNVSYWLCYLNSPINPFCYALANAQFKRTFLRLLHFDCHRT